MRKKGSLILLKIGSVVVQDKFRNFRKFELVFKKFDKIRFQVEKFWFKNSSMTWTGLRKVTSLTRAVLVLNVLWLPLKFFVTNHVLKKYIFTDGWMDAWMDLGGAMAREMKETGKGERGREMMQRLGEWNLQTYAGQVGRDAAEKWGCSRLIRHGHSGSWHSRLEKSS